MSFFSGPFFVEYFKDMVLVVLFLIGFAIWFRARRTEIINARVNHID